MRLEIENDIDDSEAGPTLAKLGKWEVLRLDWNNLCLYDTRQTSAAGRRDIRKAKFFLLYEVALTALSRAWADEGRHSTSERRKRLKEAVAELGGRCKPQSEVEHEAEVAKRRAVSHPQEETKGKS